MPAGTDFRQAIIMAVENQGTAALDQLRASLKVVQEQIDGWNLALRAGTTSTMTHASAVAKLIQVQNDLKDAVVVARTAEGDAMRARIEQYARQEQAAEQLRASIERTTVALEKEAAAEQWVTRQAAQLSAVLEGLAEDERTAATATVTHTAAMAAGGRNTTGFATAADQAAQASKRFGYSILNVAHAAQDAQYGVGALLNNIPLVVQAFGGGAGLAGGIMIAAVALDTLSRHSSLFSEVFVDDFKAAMDQQNVFADSVDKLKDKLKELESKEYKTRVDYQDIDLAQKKLDMLTEAESSYQRLKTGKSKAAQEAGRLATEAIVEHGGGDDFETSVARVTRAAQAATAAPESDAEKALKKTIAEETASLRKAESEGGDPEVMAAQREFIVQKRQELESSFAGARRQQQKGIETMVGRAGAGYGGDIRSLIGIMQANPAAFRAQGVGPGLLPGLLRSTPERVEERKAQENAARIAADRRQQAEKLARDEAENIRHEQQMKEQAAREAARQQAAKEQAGVDQIRIDQRLKAEREQAANRAKAEADRADRAAPGLQRRQAEQSYGQEFQSRARKSGVFVGGGDAEKAGKAVADLVGNGEDVEAAFRRVFLQMSNHARQTNMAMLRMLAQAEQAQNVVGEATLQLQMIMQQQQRPAVRRPTRARN